MPTETTPLPHACCHPRPLGEVHVSLLETEPARWTSVRTSVSSLAHEEFRFGLELAQEVQKSSGCRVGRAFLAPTATSQRLVPPSLSSHMFVTARE